MSISSEPGVMHGGAPEPSEGIRRDTSPPAEASVRLEGVTKSYGDVHAVRGLDLEVFRGEFFTLLGASGCGKTTTLRLIAGFEEPTAGRVLIDDLDVSGLPAFKRPTNTVFQSYALFPHLSVEDNVAFGLRRQGVAKAEVRRRVAEELERVGLGGEARRRPRQLSGGQQQRVALARALVNLPSVLLLDEPLGALDLKLRKSLQIELGRIQREVGITFVYVTHDQEEALTMSDRIAVMERGRIAQLDRPEAVYEKPATAFVAGFIGVSNLMPGRVEAVHGDQAEVRLLGGALLDAPAVPGLAAGASCHAVVRPEKLLVEDPGAPRSGRPGVDGVVESSVYLGTATQMVVRLAGDTRMTALVPNADEADRRRLPGPGEAVRLSWAGEHTHLIGDDAGASSDHADAAALAAAPA